MTERGDEYRIRAAEMHIKAEKNELFREEFENLTLFYLRLADQADRIEQMFEPDQGHHQRPHQPQPTNQAGD